MEQEFNLWEVLRRTAVGFSRIWRRKITVLLRTAVRFSQKFHFMEHHSAGEQSENVCTVCPVITLGFEMVIWTWRSGYRVPKMLFWWSLDASFLCPVAWGEFKPLIWQLKEFKVKINFQPCFAEQKAHGVARNRSSSRGNLDVHPWKFLEI